jgi:hypothetical protein
MDYMHYVIEKQGNFLDIDTDGELFVADTFARSAFPGHAPSNAFAHNATFYNLLRATFQRTRMVHCTDFDAMDL